MESTYQTWLKVCQHHKIPRTDWKLNSQYNYIEFLNKSRVDLVDVAYRPSDPFYERFGSLEFTGGWIEEAGEVDEMAFEVLKSRVGRQRNDEFNLLPPKIFITCNPKKNWLYQKVYKSHKQGQLSSDYCFIQSLYGDNPYTAQEYGQTLSQINDKVTKQRLMLGDWEYDDEQNTLIDYESIIDIFTNPVVPSEKKFLVADIARYGRDKTVISIWDGLVLEKFEVMQQQGVDQVAEKIRTMMFDYQIPYSQCVVDDDGVGGGVVDILRGIHGFINNSAPIKVDTSNYANLKTQCAYLLAEKIKNHEIKVEITDVLLKNQLIEELEQIKAKDIDSDNKRKLIPKDEIKVILGRSPDFADNLVMRMFFELYGLGSGEGGRIIRSNFKSRL